MFWSFALWCHLGHWSLGIWHILIYMIAAMVGWSDQLLCRRIQHQCKRFSILQSHHRGNILRHTGNVAGYNIIMLMLIWSKVIVRQKPFCIHNELDNHPLSCHLQSSESLLRVDMKVVLTWASKGHPGCKAIFVVIWLLGFRPLSPFQMFQRFSTWVWK